jgi:hypothetical protein
MTTHFLSRQLLFFVVSSLLLTEVIHSQQTTHKITFTFDYDFAVTPACSLKVKQVCVQQFNIYDISAGIPKRVKLGLIPVPAGASELVKGISATTESHLNSGRHTIAVAAQLSDGTESDLRKCVVIVKIP